MVTQGLIGLMGHGNALPVKYIYIIYIIYINIYIFILNEV